MLKSEEQASPTSCLNRALPTERVFVLLARDAAAPVAIREWVAERIRSRKNERNDPLMVEAIDCAMQMEQERPIIRHQLHELQKDSAQARLKESMAKAQAAFEQETEAIS